MANAIRGKKVLLVAVVIACVCALASVPAYAFWYVHDETLTEEESTGVIEIALTLDETAIGGGVKAGVVFVPEGSTAADVLIEGIDSSESQQGIDDIHDYSVTSLAEELSGQSYTIEVYAADSQEPGTQTTQDATPETGEDVVLERWDNVVITVE